MKTTQKSQAELSGFPSAELCIKCKGNCCKVLPGIVYPDDISTQGRFALKVGLRKLLRSGNYAIDWWDGDLPEYFIRPACTNAPGELLDPSWGGTCVFLTDSGCKLEFNQRPESCRFLEPKPKFPIECDINGHTKRHGVDAWLPHQDIIQELITELD